MREIKFRAWDCDLKLMSKSFSFGQILNFKDKYYKSVNIKEQSIMQFTGLMDKIGNKIYEGDIIRSDSFVVDIGENKRILNSEHSNWYRVFWDSEYLCFAIETVKTTRVGNFGIGHISKNKISIFTDDGEVVGNIWENPELIKHCE